MFDALLVFEEQLQIHLKYCLQQTHVGTLVQTDLMFPDVDDQHLACREGEQGAFPFKVLILASFPAVCPFHVHDKDIIRHARIRIFMLRLVFRHPDALCGLSSLPIGHDRELSSEQMIQ